MCMSMTVGLLVTGVCFWKCPDYMGEGGTPDQNGSVFFVFTIPILGFTAGKITFNILNCFW